MSARRRSITGAGLMALLAFSQTARPAIAATDSLAMKAHNPIADLATLPIEGYFEFDSGERDAAVYTLDVRPVIPFNLNENWLLVTRSIVPYIHQHSTSAGERDRGGLGDISQSFFLSPTRFVGGWIAGAGPVFLFPSATESELGAGKWGAGPTAAVIKQQGGWTFGLLANHIWSFAGDSNREHVTTTLMEPLVSYTWSNDLTVEFDGETTFDWKHDQWNAPLSVGVSQLVTIGKQSVSLELDGEWYAAHPDDGPEWGLVFSVTLLFPR